MEKRHETIPTIRECINGDYKTIIINDNLEERSCKHCGGLMKIIATSENEI